LPQDGRSLVPLLDGNTEGWPDRMIFSHQNRFGETRMTPGGSPFSLTVPETRPSGGPSLPQPISARLAKSSVHRDHVRSRQFICGDAGFRRDSISSHPTAARRLACQAVDTCPSRSH
jgi:hypothetical protein